MGKAAVSAPGGVRNRAQPGLDGVPLPSVLSDCRKTGEGVFHSGTQSWGIPAETILEKRPRMASQWSPTEISSPFRCRETHGFPGEYHWREEKLCVFYREAKKETGTFRTKYRKGGIQKDLRRYAVDKCPRQEYNSELLLMKLEYYSLGGCIYE